MDTILVLSDRLKFKASEDLKIIYPESRTDMARRLVRENRIRCLILDFLETSEENRMLLVSLKQNFPVLNTAVIIPRKFRNEVPDYIYLETETGDGSIKEGLISFIKDSRNINKRENNRFNWPLTAHYSDGKEWRELEIYSISAGGAYLKCSGFTPEPGNNGKIIIKFNRSRLEAECRVTDNRGQSSKMPFGFGIQFTSLSDNTKKQLDRIVNDAIVSLLLDPWSEPEVPTLGKEGLDEDDPFSL